MNIHALPPLRRATLLFLGFGTLLSARSQSSFEKAIPASPFSIEPSIRSSQLVQGDGSAFVLTNANIGTLGDADMLLLKVNGGGDITHSLTIGDMGGMGYHDVGMEAVQLGGGLFICGYTRSIDTAATPTFTSFLVKTDTALNFQWQKNYILPGPLEIYANTMTSTDNGQLLIGGQIYDGSDFQSMIMKVAADGSVVWIKQYEILHGERIHCLRELPGGDILVSGNAVFGFELVLPMAFKVNMNGDFLWGKYYNYPPMSIVENSNFLFIHAQSVDDILLCGHTDVLGAGGEDFYVVDIDSSGAINWARTYGGSQSDWAYGAQFDAVTNELVMMGNSSSFTSSFTPIPLAMRISSSGLMLAAKLYGDTTLMQPALLDHCQRIDADTRILSGPRLGGADDLYLCGTDYVLNNTCNVYGITVLPPPQVTTSGVFTAIVTQPSLSTNDVAFGTSSFNGGAFLCNMPTAIDKPSAPGANPITILPNPATGPFSVVSDLAFTPQDVIEVLNAQGKVIASVNGTGGREATINAGLASGVYAVRIWRNGVPAGTARAVVR